MRSACILAATLLLGSCATGPLVTSSASVAAPALEQVPDLETRALLLLLGDRRLYEPVAIRGALDGDAETRRRLALTLGNLADPRGLSMLEALLVDESVVVRRSAVFALGKLLEDRTGAARLALDMVGDPDRRTGELAVEALARLGVSLSSVTQKLDQGPPEEFLPRLLPSLDRFRAGASPPEEAVIRRLAEQDDSDPASLPRLRAQLDDPATEAVVDALLAVRRLLVRGLVAPPDAWRGRILELLDDPRPGVRVTAIEASASWLLDEDLSAKLVTLARRGHPRERELALLALTEGGDPQATPLIAAAASAVDPVERAAAATAGGLLGEFDVVRRLRKDPSPQVRVAAWQALLAGRSVPEELGPLAREALRDEDLAVRATALRRLERFPVVEKEALLDALRAGVRDRMPTARLAAIEALRARAATTPSEMDAIFAVLEQLAGHEDLLLRRAASDALVALGGEPPALGSREDHRTMDTWREIVVQTFGTPHLEVVTERGAFRIELACSEAPLHCLNFLQWARQGYFDDLVFHRVVPGVLVQSGDPRGDGWGGPGYTLRDEDNLLRFKRGVLGMARSAPDAGGSQFFLTLTDQPRFDGAYTAFGQVVEGVEVLDLLMQGDRIVRLREIPQTSR